MNASVRKLIAVMSMGIPAVALGAPPPGASSCLGCHPVTTDGGPVLSLSSLQPEQMVSAMQAFRTGARPSTVMDRVAKGFTDEEVRAIAQWYAREKK